MKKIQFFFNRIPFYILITGIYPVLFLWMVNFIRVPGYVAPRSLLISLAFTAIVFLLTWFVIRPLPRAALVNFVWLVLFFTYGHIFALVDNMQVSGFLAGRHRFFVPLWLGIGILATFLILRSKSDHKNATQALNIVLTLLLALTGIQIGIAAAKQGLASHPAPAQAATAAPAVAQSGANTGRDVYYFLLDGYSRLDRMRDFGVDNQPFLDKLTQLGFVIPNCGQSNYTDTESSMAANLNMNYLDKLGFTYPQLDPSGSDREYLLTPSITSSLVRQKFKALGYKFISYKTPYLFIDMPDSDVYLDAETATNPGEKIETLVKNFQAYYFPDNGKALVYPSMTSVNTFRMVFDAYFAEHLPLLPDQSLLLDAKYPGGYKIVPPSCAKK